MRKEDAPVSQLSLCDKFGLNGSEERARLGCIFLNCNKRKGHVDAVLVCGKIRGAKKKRASG